jgi:hypothetical protein
VYYALRGRRIEGEILVVHKDYNPEATPREHSLDELAKGLANHSLSRKQAFKWFGGALIGGVLASIPGIAWAQEQRTFPTLPTQAAPQAQAAAAGCNPPCQTGEVCDNGKCVSTCPPETPIQCPRGSFVPCCPSDRPVCCTEGSHVGGCCPQNTVCVPSSLGGGCST